jgi:hypothetical protein
VSRLSALGCETVPVDMAPLSQVAQLLYGGPWVAERHAVVQELLSQHPQAMDPVVRQVIAAARGHDATAAFRARYALEELRERIVPMWDKVDVLMVPTAPTCPTRAEVFGFVGHQPPPLERISAARSKRHRTHPIFHRSSTAWTCKLRARNSWGAAHHRFAVCLASFIDRRFIRTEFTLVSASVQHLIRLTARRLLLATYALLCATVATVRAENPIIQTNFTADPAPLVLWTDKGVVASLATFPWANQHNDAWAPQVVARNGKFYLYAPVTVPGNPRNVIAVAVADRPEGPFKDALGKPLIDKGDGFFDPTVFVDDDGQACLYWGNPKLWYVKLNERATSWTTTPIPPATIRASSISWEAPTSSASTTS